MSKHAATPDPDQPVRLSANQMWEIGNVIYALTEHGDNESFDTDNRHVSFGNIPVNGDDGEPVGEIVMDAETGGWFFEVAR